MNALLEQFLSEAREFLQGIDQKLLQLERSPDDAGLINELFRLVHTLKGNSGLFEFPEMTRVLHAGEDLMDVVRCGGLAYSQNLADQLLNTMDFVGLLCDEIESKGCIDAGRATDSARLAADLRSLIPCDAKTCAMGTSKKILLPGSAAMSGASATPCCIPLPLADIPESVRMEVYQRTHDADHLHWIAYTPEEECFFKGDDPLFTVRQTPELLWGGIVPRESWPPLAELNAYRCVLDFHVLSAAPLHDLAEHFRYILDQVSITAVDPRLLIIPQGDPNGGPDYDDFVDQASSYLEAGDVDGLRQTAFTMLELSNPALWFSSALRWLLLLLECQQDNHATLWVLIKSLRSLTPPDWTTESEMSGEIVSSEDGSPGCDCQEIASALTQRPELSAEDMAARKAILAVQREILALDDNPDWQSGRIKAVATVLINCYEADGDMTVHGEIEAALEQSLSMGNTAPLLTWLDANRDRQPVHIQTSQPITQGDFAEEKWGGECQQFAESSQSQLCKGTTEVAESPGFGRRADDSSSGPIKVDQAKIDRLMDLIGEMVVSKNALPYLAQRAEVQHGVRELAREIKTQYAVINRIVEEMQDAIMQVRMRPVSFVFQRFPRLVRDISRRLGKDVDLVLEGEETEADKNIIESLADPLIHIVRNSLDHGIESPDERRASGKHATGTLTIRASQETDRVLIDITDDGKGIDPAVIKRKAYEKGVIDEAALERISDQEAINLVFAAGFSTVEKVSDLSGRGVGMDVVRTGVEKVNGSIQLESEVGKGTRIRIALPLSMAVSKVMLVEANQIVFGVPMDYVMETVRVPRASIRTIKHSQAIMLRGRVVPLKSLNALLDVAAKPKANDDDELAVLVARVGNAVVGILVDDFRETVDVIQKPLIGVLSNLVVYSGSALMGDGSVLMVLNMKELV